MSRAGGFQQFRDQGPNTGRTLALDPKRAKKFAVAATAESMGPEAGTHVASRTCAESRWPRPRHATTSLCRGLSCSEITSGLLDFRFDVS